MAPALAAVLAEIEREDVDVIVSCGDLTWGPLPEETHELARGLNAQFVRGNADRAVLERVSETERERWMQEHHDDELRDFLSSFEDSVSIDVDGLGPVRLAHGSPPVSQRWHRRCAPTHQAHPASGRHARHRTRLP